MKKQNGVTVLSLSVYIIVSVVILATLSFLNINFMSRIADLTVKSEKGSEVLKVQAFVIADLKSANRVLEFSNKYLRLDNGTEYLIKYRANEKEEEQTYNIYELYRNNVLVTDELSNIEFGFDNSLGQEVITMKLYYTKDDNVYGSDYSIKVGRGY